MRLLSNILAFSLILSLGVAESQNTTKSSSDIIRTNTDNIKVVDNNKRLEEKIARMEINIRKIQKIQYKSQ